MSEQRQTSTGAPSGGGYRGGCLFIALGLALAWAVAAGVHGFNSWPHIPMDVSANDPATKAAFQAVVQRHVAVYAAVALIPLIAVSALSRLICRRRGRR